MMSPMFRDDVRERELPSLAIISVWFGAGLIAVTAVGHSLGLAESLLAALQFVLVALILASLLYVPFRAEDSLKLTAIPLLINVGTLVIINLVPYASLWQEVTFRWHWPYYRQIIRKVEAGEWQPDADGRLQLPDPYRYLSDDDGRIWVSQTEARTAVFFPTEYNGRDDVSGYLYRSDYEPPQTGDFLGHWRTVIPKRPAWYYCQSR